MKKIFYALMKTMEESIIMLGVLSIGIHIANNLNSNRYEKIEIVTLILMCTILLCVLFTYLFVMNDIRRYKKSTEISNRNLIFEKLYMVDSHIFKSNISIEDKIIFISFRYLIYQDLISMPMDYVENLTTGKYLVRFKTVLKSAVIILTLYLTYRILKGDISMVEITGIGIIILLGYMLQRVLEDYIDYSKDIFNRIKAYKI